MKRLFFIYGLFFWYGITWCSDFCLSASTQFLRTTPYSFLGTAIDIELPDKNGLIHNLADCKGRPRIVCFIKSIMVGEQCVLLSYLLRFYPWFQREGFDLFGITTELLDTSINNNSLLSFPLLLDYKQTVSKHYCTDANSPFCSACTTFIIDEQGIIKRVFNIADIGELVAQIAINVLEMNKNKTTQIPHIEESEKTLEKSAIASSLQHSAAPDFALFDSEGNLVRLSSYRGTWVLLAFANTIRGTWEYERFLYRLNDIYAWLQEHHITILCACTESVEDLACFKKQSGVPYCLLSDSKHVIPESFEEPWSLCNEFLSYLIDPAGKKVTTFISASADLHFAQLCRYIISHQKVKIV